MPPCAEAASSRAACTLAGSVTSASRASAPALRTPSRVACDRATPATAQPSATSVSIAARPRLRAPKMIALRSLPRLSPIEGSVSTHTSNPAPPPPLFRGSDRQPGPAHVYTSPMFGRRSSFEIDEQCNSDHDENEGDDQPRDERDFDEGGGALLTVCGDLLQTCRLLPRVTNHAYNLRFDRLAELQLVRWSVAVLSDATFLLVIVHDATSGGSVPKSLIPGIDMSLLASTTRDADRGFRASDLSSPDPGDWRHEPQPWGGPPVLRQVRVFRGRGSPRRQIVPAGPSALELARDEFDLAQFSRLQDAQSQASADAVADEQPLQAGEVGDRDALALTIRSSGRRRARSAGPPSVTSSTSIPRRAPSCSRTAAVAAAAIASHARCTRPAVIGRAGVA